MVSSYLTRVNAKTREAASVILSQNAVFYPRIYTCAILDGLKEVRGRVPYRGWWRGSTVSNRSDITPRSHTSGFWGSGS